MYNAKKEIHTYEAPWTTYTTAWSRRQDGKFRMAVGSIKEEYSNQIQIIELNKEEGVFNKLSEFNHPYPPTKVMFAPPTFQSLGNNDLIATTGDYLRLWSVEADNSVVIKATLNNNKHSGEYVIPMSMRSCNKSRYVTRLCLCLTRLTIGIVLNWELMNANISTSTFRM